MDVRDVPPDLDWPDALTLGAATVLTGVDRGKYPHGNSLLCLLYTSDAADE